MKWIYLLVTFSLFSCASTEKNTDRNPTGVNDSVNCALGLCVDDQILHIEGKTKSEAVGTIQNIKIVKWGRLNIPYAEVLFLNGKTVKELDMRSFSKFPMSEEKCLIQRDIKFCAGQMVATIPGYSEGDHKIVRAKIWGVAETSDLLPAGSKRLFVITESLSESEKVKNNWLLGMDTNGFCPTPEKALCVGSTYDNGLGSKDLVKAYFPYTDEYMIVPGDTSGRKKELMLKSEIVKDRISKKYETVYKYPASVKVTSGKSEAKDMENIKKRISNVVKEECKGAFNGQGVLDVRKSAEPNITHCKNEAGSRDSYMICEVDYTYYCTHKILAK